MPSFTSHDGTRLHVDLIGDASLPPLVVLAGGPARHPEYLGDLGGLSSRRRLVVLHQRGVGESESGPDTEAGAAAATWPGLAEDVEALRLWLELDRIELLGHSAGTRVAIAYAAAHPEHVERLCLVTPPATWLVDTDDDSAGIISKHAGEDWYPDFLDAVPGIMSAPDSATGNQFFPRLAPAAWAVWNDAAKAHERLGAWHPVAQDAFVRTIDDEAVYELRDALKAVTAQVLVVAGAEDGLTGLAPVVALAERFPYGQAVVLDDCGHYPWIEQPRSFSAALTPFFPLS